MAKCDLLPHCNNTSECMHCCERAAAAWNVCARVIVYLFTHIAKLPLCVFKIT